MVSTGWKSLPPTEVFTSEQAPMGRSSYGRVFYSQTLPEMYALGEGFAPDMRRLRGPPSRKVLLEAQEKDKLAGEFFEVLDNSTEAAPQVQVTGGQVVRAPDGLLVFKHEEAGS